MTEQNFEMVVLQNGCRISEVQTSSEMQDLRDENSRLLAENKRLIDGIEAHAVWEEDERRRDALYKIISEAVR